MWIDIVILVFLAVCAVECYRDGLVKTLSNLLGWVAAVIAGYFFWRDLDGFLRTNSNIDAVLAKFVSQNHLDMTIMIISFILIVIVVKVIISILAVLFDIVKIVPVLSFLNKMGGGAVGLIKGVVILWIVLFLVMPYVDFDEYNGVARAFDGAQLTPLICDCDPLFMIFEEENIKWN